MLKSTVIMDKKMMHRALVRIAHEIVERNQGTEKLVLIGIKRRGDHIARRLQQYIQNIEGATLPVGALDITLYRDDFQMIQNQPIVGQTEVNFDITDKIIVLVDDVLFSGRTIRAALSEIVDFGRSGEIQLAVLIDRGHRELPIRPDYVGKNIPTQKSDHVVVKLDEIDNNDEVILEVES